MAIQLAFSTVACPQWTLEQVAQQAVAFGYTGVELRTLGAGGSGLSCDPSLSDPSNVAQVFQAHNIAPVCLSTSIGLYDRHGPPAKEVHWQVVKQMEQAAEIGCEFLRVFGGRLSPGEDLRSGIQQIAQRLGPLADHAGKLGVKLLLENGGSLATAKPWWWLLELVNHPMVGMLWNAANAVASGEPASVSVPMLNSRIRLAKLKDLRLGQGDGYVTLGEGTVGIESFIQRLLGVGYDGYLTVEWDRLWLGSLAPAEEYLPDARQRVAEWLESISQAVDKGKALAAKQAAKNAPKPASQLQAASTK